MRICTGIKQTKSQQTYKNYLATLKVLFRDYPKQPEVVQDFKFPRLTLKPKVTLSFPPEFLKVINSDEEITRKIENMQLGKISQTKWNK